MKFLHQLRPFGSYLIKNSLLSILVLLIGIMGGSYLFVEGLIVFSVIASLPAMIILVEVVFTIHDYFALLGPRERDLLMLCIAISSLPILIGVVLSFYSVNLLKLSGLIAVIEGISMFIIAHIFSKNKFPIPRIGNAALKQEDEPDGYRLQLWYICTALGRIGLLEVFYGLMVFFKT